jgi:hypothetical protein
MKKMILTLALALCASLAAQAQVYSNTVGMIKIDIPDNGLVFVSFPFEVADYNLQSVVGDQLSGSTSSGSSDRILVWNVNTSKYDTFWKVEGTDTVWDGKWIYDQPGQPVEANVNISTGQGFWVQSRSSSQQTLNVNGNVPASPVQISIPLGLTQIGVPYPVSMNVNSPEFDINSIATGSTSSGSSDRLIFWDEDTQTYIRLWLVENTGTVYDGKWILDEPGAPQIADFDIIPGVGFWFQRRDLSTNWTPPVPYTLD